MQSNGWFLRKEDFNMKKEMYGNEVTFGTEK